MFYVENILQGKQIGERMQLFDVLFPESPAIIHILCCYYKFKTPQVAKKGLSVGMIDGHVNVNYLKGMIVLFEIHCYDMAIWVKIKPGDFKSSSLEKESCAG